MNRTSSETEQRLADLLQTIPQRGHDLHASLLKTIFDLPHELISPSVTALADRDPPGTIIVFPAQIQRGHHFIPRQALLFTSTRVIHLLASIWPEQEPEMTCLGGLDLMYMRITLQLLYGYLEIVGRGSTQPVRLGMEFNTLAWYGLCAPLTGFLQTVRSRSRHSHGKTPVSTAAQRQVEKLPLKFSNGARIYGILPGETLEELVFQPASWNRFLLLFRRPVSANTLLLLTTHFVALIQEELKVSHGWIISYIPRDCIASVTNRPRRGWNDLAFRLDLRGQSTEYKFVLNSRAALAWQSAWTRQGGIWQELSEIG